MNPVPPSPTQSAAFSRYTEFDRERWKALRASTPLLLSEEDLASLRGINDQVSLREVSDIYVPLSRLLNLHFSAVQHLYDARQQFLGVTAPQRVPYIIGIAGSVAVGKSTFARVLRASLARWPDHQKVDLITTDGFLYPNRVLQERDLMRRKGFPESYDLRRMLAFLTAVKSGETGLEVPIYAHDAYDIIPGQTQTIERPDILIFEGLNVLQTVSQAATVASDFFDFSIYLDADPSSMEAWYVARLMLLQRTAFQNPSSYFHHLRDWTPEQVEDMAHRVWAQINLPNLTQNIQPTRERANLVIRKGRQHAVEDLWLRRT